MAFATKWRGQADRLLWYSHAPPPSNEDIEGGWIRRGDLPKDPYKGAPSYKRSVYYYWWAFLRENEEYYNYAQTRSGQGFQQLFKDFGDVWTLPFMDWWNTKGRFQFCELLERNVRVHKPDEQGRILDIRDPAEKIILALPVHGDLERILAEVEQLILRERPAIPKSASWKEAKYHVSGKPVLSSLEKRLTVLQARKRHPDKTLHELADIVGLKFGPKSEHKEGKAIYVSRYLKQAKCIIDHVGKGQFPILG